MVNEYLPSRPQVRFQLTGQVWRKSARCLKRHGLGLTLNDLALRRGRWFHVEISKLRLPGENPALAGLLLPTAADIGWRDGRTTEQSLEEGRAAGTIAGEAHA